MLINIKTIFLIILYILSTIYNIYRMRKLLIIDRNRIESYADVIITIVLILLPLVGAFFIEKAIYEKMSYSKKALMNNNINKIITKIFFIK